MYFKWINHLNRTVRQSFKPNSATCTDKPLSSNCLCLVQCLIIKILVRPTLDDCGLILCIVGRNTCCHELWVSSRNGMLDVALHEVVLGRLPQAFALWVN